MADLTPEMLAGLRALQARATQGEWELQDSCSWRRIGTAVHDGNVLCPTNSRSDNHPDLMSGHGEDTYANLELIVAAVNALPALLDAAEREAAARKRVEELEAALRPFSEASEDLDDAHRDGSPIWEASAAMAIDAGHLRDAARALSPRTEQEQGDG